jgi:hypothetical protein
MSQAFAKLAYLHPVLHAVSRKAMTQAVRTRLGIDAGEL